MTLYGTPEAPPSADEAAALLTAFVSRLGPRRQWFVDEVRATGGPAADGSVESLDPLARHVAARVHEVLPTPDGPPDWFAGPYRALGWSDYGATLVEGLIAYVAELMTSATAAHWELDGEPISARFRQPVLSNRVVPPWQLVLSAVEDAAEGAEPRLERFVRFNLDAAAQRAPGPPPEEQLSVEVTPVSHPEWDVQASIPESAEHVLGTATFDSLVDRFRTVEGVHDALHEDREVFLLRTDGEVEPAVLRTRLQQVLDAARS